MTMIARAVPRRRGACPGLSMPMQTGDGLLVRLLPNGTIPLAAFMALCKAAQTRGNGVIEITSRGSIQVRGLSDASAPEFAETIAALNIAAEDGIPVLCNALAGLDAEEIFDSASVAAELRRTIAQLSLASKLSPKVSVVIDGGGAIGLQTVAADIRLLAQTANGDVALRMSVGGDEAHATELGYVAPAHAVEATMRLLDVIARGGREARARDNLAAAREQIFRLAVAGLLVSAPPRISEMRRAWPLPPIRCATARWPAASDSPSAMPMRIRWSKWLRQRRQRAQAACVPRLAERFWRSDLPRQRRPVSFPPPSNSASSRAPMTRAAMSSPAPVRRFALRRISPRVRWRPPLRRPRQRRSAAPSIFPAAPRAVRTPRQLR